MQHQFSCFFVRRLLNSYAIFFDYGIAPSRFTPKTFYGLSMALAHRWCDAVLALPPHLILGAMIHQLISLECQQKPAAYLPCNIKYRRVDRTVPSRPGRLRALIAGSWTYFFRNVQSMESTIFFS